MSKPRLLDLFCGAGGATKGYQDAGFFVTGVDIEPQPNYCGDAFARADALNYLRWNEGWIREQNIAAIHASPPCQHHSTLNAVNKKDHPDLIVQTRELLKLTGLPYVIENVVGAPLENPIMLCGSAFGRKLYRHRLFECNFPVMAPPCSHGSLPADSFDVYEHGHWYKAATPKVYGSGGGKAREHWAEVMQIDWMTDAEIVEAIPPYFTAHVGEYLIAHLEAQQKAAA